MEAFFAKAFHTKSLVEALKLRCVPCCARDTPEAKQSDSDSEGSAPQGGRASSEEGCLPPLPEPLPLCLSRAGSGNHDVPPESWAMTVEQWHQVVDECRQTPSWQVAAGSKGYVNMYDLNRFFIRPWTRGTGSSVALRLNADRPLAAEVMVSHSWAEDLEECAEALAASPALPPQTRIWFCAFSVYQPGDEAGDGGLGIQEQLALDPFGRVIQRLRSGAVGGGPRGGMVVVHTSRAEVYDRLWCVYEIAVALRCQVPISVACSQSYFDASRGRVLDVLKVSAKKAQCFSSKDRRMINRKVRAVGGYKALDSEIFQFRMEMLRSLAHQHGQLDTFRDELDAAEKSLRRRRDRSRRSLKVWTAASVLLCTTVVCAALVLTRALPPTPGPQESPPALPPTTLTTTSTMFSAPQGQVEDGPRDGAPLAPLTGHDLQRICVAFAILASAAAAAAGLAVWSCVRREATALDRRIAVARRILTQDDP